MKNLTLLIFTLILFLLFPSFNNQTVNTFSLTINVQKLKNSQGLVQFVLYNNAGSIPDEKFKKWYKILKAEIVNGSSMATFNNIPIGKYAVNIFHDENNNGKVDKGIILPIEGIGFSNYQTIGLSNKPNFENASFILNSNTVLMIKMIYL